VIRSRRALGDKGAGGHEIARAAPTMVLAADRTAVEL
jgi:hypothetical protein